MGLFKGLFGKKEAPVKTGTEAPKPVDITAGLNYMDVRKEEDSTRKWNLMVAFAQKGDEIALQDVGEAYMMGQHGVAKDSSKAEKYLLAAIEKGMALSAVRLGQMYMRDSFDVYKNENNMTEEELQEADKAFDEKFEKGASYLVSALNGTNLTHVEYAIKVISGTSALGYNVGEMRDYFMEQVNKYLPEAVKKIEAAVSSENNEIASAALYKTGSLYLYGVHYEDDLDMAKECYEKSLAKNQWNAHARAALRNPLFAED